MEQEKDQYDFQKICRACLSEHNSMNSVYELTLSTNKRIHVTDFLRRLTSLKVSKGDGLPENICTYCIKQIHLAYDFSQLCISSDAKLRLQRNRTVLHNIQREIVEEEEIILCAENDLKDKTEDVCISTATQFSNEENTCDLVCSVQVSNTIDNCATEINENSNSSTSSQVNSNSVLNLSVNNCEIIEETQENENKTISDTQGTNINKRNRKTQNRYSCTNCSETFYTEEKLQRHAALHDPTRAYRCGECNKSFSKKSHLNIHLRCHAKKEDKKFMCKECGQQFMYSYLLKQHSYKHTDEKPFPCPKCDKGCITAESLKRHMKVHEKNYTKKKRVCHICSKEFAYPSFLAEHMKNHTGERPFLCNICGKGFRQNGALDYHMRSHTGHKPFTCQICNNKFMSQSVLRVHMRRHTNERPYVCDVCGVAFRQSTDMRSHKRTHTGEKPVLCTICGKRMSTTGQLTVHIRSHTGEKPYQCPTCSKCFATRTMLVKHERIHTGERPYKCTICNKAFNQSGTLKTHVNTHKMCKKPRTRASVAAENKNDNKEGKETSTIVLNIDHGDDAVDKLKNDGFEAHILYVGNGEHIDAQHGQHNEHGSSFTLLPAPIPLLHNL